MSVISHHGCVRIFIHVLRQIANSCTHDKVPGLEVVTPHGRDDLLLRYRQLRQPADHVLQIVGLW